MKMKILLDGIKNKTRSSLQIIKSFLFLLKYLHHYDKISLKKLRNVLHKRHKSNIKKEHLDNKIYKTKKGGDYNNRREFKK